MPDAMQKRSIGGTELLALLALFGKEPVSESKLEKLREALNAKAKELRQRESAVRKYEKKMQAEKELTARLDSLKSEIKTINKALAQRQKAMAKAQALLNQ